jgi:hypothetical protein
MKISIALEAMTGKFETDMNRASKRAEREWKNFQRQVSAVAKAVAVAVVAAGAAFAGLVRQSINTADEMGKTAQRIGVSTESLSQLQHAANLSGTSLEGLNTGLLRLSRTASDAANGMAGPSRAFAAIGVSAKNLDGTLKGTEELMLEVADKFAEIEDGAGKAALAQELFGRSGAQLIPMLNQGRDGLEAMKREADKLGLTIDGQTSKAAQRFNDQLTRLRGAFDGIIRQAAARLLPTLEAIADKFVETVTESDILETALNGLENAFKTLVSVGLGVAAAFNAVGTVLGATAAAIVQRDFRIIGQAFDDLRERAVDQIETIVNVWKDNVDRMARDTEGGAGRIRRALVFGDDVAAPIKSAADATISAAERTIAVLEQQAATLGMTERQAQNYRLEMEGGDAAQRRYADSLLASIEAHGKLDRQMADAARVIDDNKNASERFADEIARLNDLVAAGVLPWVEYEKAVARVQDQFFPIVEKAEEAFSQVDEFARQAARNMQDAFAQFIFDPFKDGLSGMVKGFADAMRRMLAEAAAAALLKQMFEGFGSSSNPFLSSLSKAFGGSRDSGGRGYPGQAYMIGTGAQPEMFIPDTAGTFVPASKQGGQSVTYQTIVQAPEGRITRESEGRLRAAQMQQLSMMGGRNS